MLTAECQDNDKKGERVTLICLNSPALISVDWSKLQHLLMGQSSDPDLCRPYKPNREAQSHITQRSMNTEQFYISIVTHIMLNCSSLALIQKSRFFFFPLQKRFFTKYRATHKCESFLTLSIFCEASGLRMTCLCPI